MADLRLPVAMFTVNAEGVVQFELAGRVLAENRKKVQEILEGQVAAAVARKHFQDAISEWVFLRVD